MLTRNWLLGLLVGLLADLLVGLLADLLGRVTG